jgi:hypothetical protein
LKAERTDIAVCNRFFSEDYKTTLLKRFVFRVGQGSGCHSSNPHLLDQQENLSVASQLKKSGGTCAGEQVQTHPQREEQ